MLFLTFIYILLLVNYSEKIGRLDRIATQIMNIKLKSGQMW